MQAITGGFCKGNSTKWQHMETHAATRTTYNTRIPNVDPVLCLDMGAPVLAQLQPTQRETRSKRRKTVSSKWELSSHAKVYRAFQRTPNCRDTLHDFRNLDLQPTPCSLWASSMLRPKTGFLRLDGSNAALEPSCLKIRMWDLG